MDQRLALSPREAARLLGINRRHIYRAVKSGDLVAYRPGGAMASRIMVADLERWVRSSPLTSQKTDGDTYG
jgi:excisionase family DNA binding protein